MKRLLMLATIVLMLAGSSVAIAQAPGVLHYEGHLEDAEGVLVNDTVDLLFRLYDGEESEQVVWEEQHVGVVVSEGTFGTYLGQTNELTGGLFSSGPLWLAVRVGDDEELRPRQQVAGVPYALHAEQAHEAATLQGLEPGDLAAVDHGHPDLHTHEGMVWTDRNDGEGSGLDADLLAGLDSEALLEQATAQCMETVDASGFVTADEAIAAVGDSGRFAAVDEPVSGDLDMGGNEIRNPVIHNAAEAPTDPSPGQLWFDTTVGKLMSWNGEAWTEMGSNPEQVAASLVASEAFRTQVVQQLVAQHLEQVKGPQGEPGEAADPAAVAAALLQNPAFVDSVVQGLFEQHGEALQGPQGPRGEGLDDVNTDLISSVFTYEVGSEDTPITDLQDGNPVVSAIDFPHAGTIREVSVTLDVEHPDVSELRITLTSPSGTVVTLHNGEAGTGEDVSTVFPENRPLSEGGMSDFQGESSSGAWRLTMFDSVVGNSGELTEWRLNVRYLSDDSVAISGRLLIGANGNHGSIAQENGSLTLRGFDGGEMSIGNNSTGLLRALPSDRIRSAADIERVDTDRLWKKRKEIRVFYGGVVRLSVDARTIFNSGNAISFGVNGEHDDIGIRLTQAWQTYTVDVEVNTEDFVQLYTKATAGENVTTRNFRVGFDLIPAQNASEVIQD